MCIFVMGNNFPWFEFGHYLYQAFVYCKYGGDNFPISFGFFFAIPLQGLEQDV